MTNAAIEAKADTNKSSKKRIPSETKDSLNLHCFSRLLHTQKARKEDPGVTGESNRSTHRHTSCICGTTSPLQPGDGCLLLFLKWHGQV